ncbi:hypothetical protein AVEN_132399-1 [Araneus ventricosus]|uniref:Uncharacterized protein n=1 Tax=Araneus ventricosus TaxID=182803 RepID=A0A4Y2SKR9_ARAVE|nr:hypothetical protein AVEN_132399-1 [Araneus ventricosus]
MNDGSIFKPRRAISLLSGSNLSGGMRHELINLRRKQTAQPDANNEMKCSQLSREIELKLKTGKAERSGLSGRKMLAIQSRGLQKSGKRRQQQQNRARKKRPR